MEQSFSVSHTKLSTFRRCLQKYHWNYIQHYRPKPSVSQTRGSAGHSALAEWHVNYKIESAIAAAWKYWYGQQLADGDDWRLLEDALIRYFAWSQKNDSFKILQSEYEFKIGYGNPDFVFTGFIDGIVQDGKQQWLLENKFYKKVDDTGLEMDIQASLYMLAAKLLGKNVSGVIYNMVRIGDNKKSIEEPVVRKKLYRNAAGLSHVQTEMVQQVKNMLKYQEGGMPYRNPTKDCSWDCAYYSICLGLLDDGCIDAKQLEIVSQK